MNAPALALLRRSRGKTQVEVAAAMRVSQSAVSKIESGRDVSLAQLRDYIAALGGVLEVSARFAEETTPIDAVAVPYGDRAPTRREARRVREAAVSTEWDTVVAPEWLAEVDRIRAMTPRDRLQELANGAAFFAAARRID
jgi:transcriptional regulator with XRE-family HTH domain